LLICYLKLVGFSISPILRFLSFISLLFLSVPTEFSPYHYPYEGDEGEWGKFS